MDSARFYASCAGSVGLVSKKAKEGCDLILAEAVKRGTPLNQLAYMLATAWWETAKTMQPVREAFYIAPGDFGKAEAWRKKNLHYYPFYGRGFVQLTWKDNYKKATAKLGHDFVNDPDAVMELRYAVPIMFDGMKEGWFTGKALDDYIDDIDEPDNADLLEYKEARRIINGQDKAETIAEIALGFEAALKEGGYGGHGAAGAAPAALALGAAGPAALAATVVALPSAASFAAKLVEKASDELVAYDGMFEQNSPLKERIGLYWTFVGRPGLDGSDDVPWSAAFISYMVHLAGAGTTFPYSTQHSVYFYRTINDRLTNRKSSFWGYKVGEVDIRPGDIIGMNRAAASQIDYKWAAHHSDYDSHSDIVVRVDDAGIHTIGGNVGAKPGQVSNKLFVWKGDALVNDASNNQRAFVVIRSFLP